MKKILLASMVDWDSLGELPAIFKRGGCQQIDVLCNKNAWLTSNRYYDNWIEIKNGTDELPEQVIQLAQDRTKNYDKIILLDDLIIRLMNESIDSEDLFKKILPLNKIENREMLSSKAGFSNVCERNNILSPRFMLYVEHMDLNIIDTRMNYPLLLKQDLSWSGAGIQFCCDKKSLEAGLEKIAVKQNLVVQEYITGEDVGVEALFHQGQLITYNMAKILDYSEAISRIIMAGNNPVEILTDQPEDLCKEIEIALFYRDIRRCWKKKDLKGFMRWVFNYKGYWRFIPLYDGLILRKIFGEIKKDFIKIGKST